jgi:hypothetical protein
MHYVAQYASVAESKLGTREILRKFQISLIPTKLLYWFFISVVIRFCVLYVYGDNIF